MNIQRGWFILIALFIGLLLSGGAYFLLLDHKPVASNIPSVAGKLSVLGPAGGSASVVSSPTPELSPQPQTGSVPPTYVYNALGQLQTITYPGGSVYSYQYNAQGDKIGETTPAGKTWSYVYDQNHHPLSIIDPEGRVTHKGTEPSASK